MKKKFLLLIVITAFVLSCKKDDVVSSQTIRGRVYNLCNDSAMTGVFVYVFENNNVTAQGVSDATGSFLISNVQIHSNSHYVYTLSSAITIDKNNPSAFHTLGFVQTGSLSLHLPKRALLTDTFQLTMQQNVYHKNYPSGNYIVNISGPPTNQSGDIGNGNELVIGWWHLTTDRIKNGVHIVKADSFYLPYNNFYTDTIPW
ncbi:MAG: hypothetical protein ABI448_09350 [Bacteroidia bacterium]